MTPDLLGFHAYLRSACPISAGDLMAEIQILRRASPKSAEGLPADALELRKAVRALEAEKLLELRDGLLFWLAERERADQGALFV